MLVLKKYVLLIILTPILFCGCQVKPDETVDGFMSAIAGKNLRRASAFCTVDLKKSVANLPYLLRNYNYGMGKIKWEVNDVFPTRSGMRARVFLAIFREWPRPEILNVYLDVDLKKLNGKWFVSSINTIVPEYTTYTDEPRRKNKYYTFRLMRPKWEVKTNIDEPLPRFLQRYNKDCRAWLY